MANSDLPIHRPSGGRSELSEVDGDPLAILPSWNRSRYLDRRNEGRHQLHLRQIMRRAEVEQAEAAERLVAERARLEAASRIVADSKYAMQRAQAESRLLAGDDPVLQQQMAVLDDSLFQVAKGTILRHLS